MSVKFGDQVRNLGSLRKRWAAFSLTGSLVLAGAYAWLNASWGQAEALRWVLPAAFAFSSLCFSLWCSLPYNHLTGEIQLLPTLGVGNTLTLLRGLLLAMLAGFLLLPTPEGFLGWLPAILMTAIAVADIFDGYLARRSNQATRFGEILDMQLDGLSLLLATALVVIYGQAPVWFLLVGLARFLFIAGIAVRRRLGKPVFDLPPSITRRPFAGAMMGFTAALLSPLFSPPATHLAAALFALPFLSGFTRDWLAVSGSRVVLPSSAHILSEAAPWRQALLRWLPVLLRAVLVLGIVIELANPENTPYRDLESLFKPGTGLISGLLLIAALLVAAGAASRVGAVFALFALGLQARARLIDGTDQALIVVATALFFLGSGALSAWTPEDRLIERRLGDRLGLDA